MRISVFSYTTGGSPDFRIRVSSTEPFVAGHSTTSRHCAPALHRLMPKPIWNCSAAVNVVSFVDRRRPPGSRKPPDAPASPTTPSPHLPPFCHSDGQPTGIA